MTTLQAQLRDLIATHFNDSEVRDLCFDLGVPYEDLGGQGKTDKVRELVAYCERYNRQNALVARCRELRTNVEWPDSAAPAVALPPIQPAAIPPIAASSAPPLELTIRFEKMGDAEDAPLRVSASVPNTNISFGPVDFPVPLDEKTMLALRWYLEEYWKWPVGPDYQRALEIEASLLKWGKTLFEAVFTHAKMMRVYEQFRLMEAPGHLVTIDAIDPRILQLPWELLADDGGYLFTQRPPISLRRKLQTPRAAKTQPFSLPVRILMVISRPEGEHVGFLDPRSSAAALLDAIEPLGDQVTVEFLYPPTLKALTKRVRDPKLSQVHVVHFDGHGVYLSRTGLGYLLFENEKHEEQLVSADDLGPLLNDTGVPLMILDACQTAQPDKTNPFGSVAAKLIDAGVGSVLAMNYSVLVPATRLLTAAFYSALANGSTIGQAVDAARFEMWTTPERLTLYRNEKEERIDLRDWFLPALYQQSIDPAPFAAPHQPPPVKRGEAGRGVPIYPARGGFPAEPRHGFHGRARELLHLERTLAEKPIVVLHGYGGQGKTTLAAHAARWFTRIHRFERAVFVSFENGGGLEWALSEMGNALIGDDFAIHQGDPVDAIAAELRSTPTLVVWDNFESILPNGSAPLPDAELQKLLNAAVQWFTPVSRRLPASSFIPHPSSLIITTRDPSLPHPDFEPGALTAHAELPGLGRLDALDLAGQILKDRGIPRPPREKLSDLLEFLGCHPLSIQLVVPHLRNNTPEKLIAEFDELLPGFTTGKGKERNESLRVSLDFSLRRLGEETRKVLPDLAVFQGGAMEAQILIVTEFKPSTWRPIRDELARAALLSIDQGAGLTLTTDEGKYAGYYVRFHPTLLPYLEPQLMPARRAELEARYAQAYYQLANYEYQEDDKNPLPTRAIVSRELPNFRRALDLTLAAGDMDVAVDFANSIAKFLNNFGRWSERDAMMVEVSRQIAVGSSQSSAISTQQSKMAGGPSSTVTQSEFIMKSNEGERLWQMGRAAEAERVFRDLLARLGEAPSYERAYTLMNLGRCLKAQGRQGVAAEVYRQELAVLAQLEQDKDVERQTGIAHTDLADVLAEMGQFDAARKEYEASLAIKKEIGGEERGIAVVLGQMGTLALMQNDLNEARRRYLEALDSDRKNGEPQGEAVWWHQLGRVAQEARDWAEAERCYKESLALEERLGHAEGAAQTCNQLAIVAKGAGRLDEAERWYKRAIELNTEIDKRDELAKNYSNLASFYLVQNRLDEAEQFAHRAREIRETLDISAEIWKTHSILAQIAEKRGRTEEAQQWRRKAAQTRQAFDERAGYQAYAKILQQFEDVIQAVIAGVNGDANARAQVDGLFDTFRKGNWQIVEAIQRIWGGERDVDALTESIDPNSAAIVRRILGLLNQPPSLTRAQPPARGVPPSDKAPTGEGSATSPSPMQGDHDPRSEAEGGGRGEGEPREGDAITQAMQQWDPVMRAVVAACHGNARAVQELEPFLNDVEKEEDWHNLVVVIRRIMQGERGVELLEGLDPVDATIVRRILGLLNQPSPPAPLPKSGEGSAGYPSPVADGRRDGEGGLTVEDIINLVIAGAQGDQQAGGQAYQIAQALQQEQTAPPEIRALGKGLQNVLEGLRGEEAVRDLPPEAAQVVRVVLAQLE
jgi:tetratricopeptide (TPR) repeat protein